MVAQIAETLLQVHRDRVINFRTDLPRLQEILQPVAIVGDEDAVAAQIQGLSDLGVTDYVAVPFPVGRVEESLARTRALLVRVASRHA